MSDSADAADADPSPAGRVAVVVGGLGLAVFFGAMGIAILRAPVSDPDATAWGGWLIKAFIALMFGSMTGIGVYGVYVGVRGRPRPPAAVLARCPACGEPRAGADCAHCGRTLATLARAWREVPREGLSAPLLGGGIGGAVLSLGLFLVSGALHEARWLMAIACAALALLLVLVGGAMLFGGLLTVRSGIRSLRRRDYNLSVHGAGEAIVAGAQVSRRALSLSGCVTVWHPIDEAPVPGPFDVHLAGPRRALARTLAVLHARGEASLSYTERRDWAIHPPGELVRALEIDVLVDAAHPQGETDVDARSIVLAALGATSVRTLAEALAAHADLRRAFDAYAERLPLDEADPRTHRLLSALLHTETPPPYRHAG
jgi:hypothetical protein